jgi:hypothetical protein
MRIIALAIVFSFPVIATAQDLPTAGEATGQANQDTSAKKVRELTFGEGDQVTADIIKPGGDGVVGEVHGKTGSLIEIRSDFVTEILTSTDDV